MPLYFRKKHSITKIVLPDNVLSYKLYRVQKMGNKYVLQIFSYFILLATLIPQELNNIPTMKLKKSKKWYKNMHLGVIMLNYSINKILTKK